MYTKVEGKKITKENYEKQKNRTARMVKKRTNIGRKGKKPKKKQRYIRQEMKLRSNKNQLEKIEKGLNNTKYENKIQTYKTGVMSGRN